MTVPELAALLMDRFEREPNDIRLERLFAAWARRFQAPPDGPADRPKP